MDPDLAPEGPLSRTEFEQLRTLMRRYLLHELDQWENWEVEMPNGSCYVMLTNRAPDDAESMLWHKL